MAPFNPTGPIVNSSPQPYNSVIQGYQPDTSTGQMLKVAGDTFTGSVKLGDEYVKDTIKKDITSNVDATRDAYTQYLVNANAGAVTNTDGTVAVPPAVQTPQGAQGTPQNLLPEDNAPDAPMGIKNGLDRFGRISTAQAQGGTKANDTAYTAQLTSIAKNLRAQYPGYRDYIDEQISSISGIPIANAYVKNLLQDLNAAQTNAKAANAKVETALMSQVTDKVPGAAAAYMNFQKTGDVAGALNFVETAKSVKARSDEALSALSLEKAQGDNTVTKAKANLDLIYGMDMNLAWKGAAAGAGVKSPEDWATMVDNAASGNVMPNSVEQRNAALALQGQRAQIEAQWRQKANQIITVQNADGSERKTTYSALVGPEAVNGIIKEKLKTFDTYIEAATNDKTGTAVYAAQHTKAYTDDLENGIRTNPSNKAMEVAGIVGRITSPQFASTVLGEALAKNIDNNVRNLFTDKTMEMLAQPRLKDGTVTTFKDIVQDAKRPDASKAGSISPNTKFFDRTLENVNILARPDAPLAAKENIARTFFDPMNRGVLLEFNPDAKDANGNTIGGREAIFKIMTAPKVTAGIAEVIKINPQIGVNYKNFIETEWGTAIAGPRLNSLKEILEGNTANKVGQEIHVAFDDGKSSGTPKIFLIDDKGRPLDRAGKSPGEKAYFEGVKDNIDKINDGLGNIHEMTRVFKGNVSVSVLAAFQNAGINIPNNKVGQAILKSAPNKELDQLEENTGVDIRGRTRRQTTKPESATY